MTTLSIIIPVYNVERYVAKCIESVLAQDFADMEIILVDDGSTDKSGKICDSYTGQDTRICVIHQKNGGLSAARNSGIEVAQGEYVCFVDSDDYWEPNVLGGLMAQVERDQLDVLRFNYRNVNENGDEIHPNADPKRHVDYSFTVCDGLTFLNERQGPACYACMYILRKTLLQECTFKHGIYFEDTEWTPRMLLRAQRVASTETIVYNYLIRTGSITKAVDIKKQRKVLEDKIQLITSLQQQVATTPTCKWFDGMIAGTAVSIIGMLAEVFFHERKKYLEQLQALNIYPLSLTMANKKAIRKIKLINLSPATAVRFLYIKAIVMHKIDF